MDFYTRVLGLQLESFIGGTPPVDAGRRSGSATRRSTCTQGREFEPRRTCRARCALDLCFIASIPLDQVIGGCTADWPIVEGPVMRTGPRRRSARSMCATPTST